ncbi:MAG: energy transducer TonB [Candidatus Acidiferrales bacterium]|jgi:TonB family protein
MNVLKSFAVVCLLFVMTLVFAKPARLVQSGATSSYDNSTEGLQKLVWEMIAAQKRGGEQALAPFLRSLILPNDAAWFAGAFGGNDGRQFAAFYESWGNARDFQLAGDIDRAIAAQMTDIAAMSFTKAGDSGTTDKDSYFLGLLKQPQTFYAVNFKSANGLTMRWAYFVYSEGAFRYLGPLADLRLVPDLAEAEAATPSEMPKRVLIGEDVLEGHIAHRVLPVYPPEALTQRLEGSVILHTIIAPDGTVQSMDATSGNPVFIPAAETAVRQWRFNPVLLNGQPVTVDTTITVQFHLASQAAATSQPGSPGNYQPIPSYPDSAGGLTKMMKQMLALSGHGENQELNGYYHALLLPSPDSWFASQFGDRDGTRFAQNYQGVEQSLPALFANTLQTETGLKYDTVEVIRFKDACTNEANETEYPVLVAREQQSTALYEVRFLKNNGYRELFPFAYVDGGFRYLGNLQIQAPQNHFLGNDVQPPKLIKEVQAIYPTGFNMPGNTGNVKLWGVIGTDGTVRDLHVIHGTCPYVKATIDAVKKWRFTPLMVDGKPQEAVYPFEYNYGLSR